jgi:hypothetical protein
MALAFDDDDVFFQETGALVGPFDDEGDRLIDENILTEALIGTPRTSVQVIHNVQVEGYGSVHDDEGPLGGVGDSRTYLYIHSTCLRLVTSASPMCMSSLWDLFRRTNTQPFAEKPTLISGIDYLEISTIC